MPHIVAAMHALPRHKVHQEELRELIRQAFAGRMERLEEQMRVFDNARIDTRYLVRPPKWYLEGPSATACNRVYLSEGVDLLRHAAAECLRISGVPATEVDHVICVSTTGHATPSLEARLFGDLGFPARTRRTPIWGLGCAAGVAGLARASEYCRAFPRSRVLLLALELCSLTFQRGDATQKNLIGSALFGDGAAAALVCGDEAELPGPGIRATRSHLFPDTARIMGWDISDSGLQLVLSPKLPLLVRSELPGLLEDFLGECGIDRSDVGHYLLHPGGARVLDAYRDALNLDDRELELSGESLRRHGNISSVSVLMVLEKWLAERYANGTGYGLMAAFGPGFAAELLLLDT